MLEDIKLLLGINISDISKDGVLSIYIRRATTLIKNYLNNDSFDEGYIQNNFQDAIIELVYIAYSSKGKENIQSERQGNKSITYKTVTSYSDGSAFMITNDIKALLPLPYAKLR